MKKIYLWRGIGKVNRHKTEFFTLVDDDDYEWLNQWEWGYKDSRGKTKYVQRYHDGTFSLMHRLILELTDSEEFADHRDGNGLNNQRNNIRKATRSQNAANIKKKSNTSSKYLGVYYRKDRASWTAHCKLNQKTTSKHGFKTEAEAALWYNEKALEFFGEFANLNIVT